MPAKTKAVKKNGSPAVAKSADNQLISIRIPKDVLEKLRGVAGQKGDIGYQQLIKAYIAGGLNQEAPEALEKGKGSALKETLAALDTPVMKPAASKRKPAARSGNSEVIAEDIANLAEALEPYHSLFEDRTFLITGAYGFLGRYMVQLLKHLNEKVLRKKTHALLLDNFVTGYEQRVFSDKNLVFHRHNVIKPFETSEQVDYLIHAAGIASPAYYTKFPIETMDVGTIGTRNMLELAYRKGVSSFLFTSSSEVYGDPDPKHVPTNEDYYGNVSITGPRSCYDESKRFGETMCLAYWRTFDVPVKIVRPFNVYGPGIRPDDFRVLPNFIEHALRKEPLPIHGDGRNTRSFCYINDAVEALFRVLFAKESGESFNIGNPYPEISVRELAYKVAEAMPFKVEVVNIDPPHAVYAQSDPKRRCPDITKLQTLTGFKPKYSLEEGLRRTIQWFSES
ncbi:MAG TPA: NAD-dependent epimerase/dehydratase family protein [Verrucomicrobiae bacterium]|jgi:UDP-glucuronate decarboxylase|nr:NAD-dependent epimerase/dehydratase family protein [Verrucomicrobiae bacterium]